MLAQCAALSACQDDRVLNVGLWGWVSMTTRVARHETTLAEQLSKATHPSDPEYGNPGLSHVPVYVDARRDGPA